MTVVGDRWLQRWVAPAVRVLLLTLTVIIGFIAAVVSQDAVDRRMSDQFDERAFAVSLAVLVLTSIAAMLPLRGATFPRAQPVVEAAVIGVVIVALAEPGFQGLFSLWLFIPTFIAGQRAGLSGALLATGLGGVPWLITILDQPLTVGQGGTGNPLVTPVLVLGALTAISMLSEWIRRLRNERVQTGDAAYADAFRLLTELQQIARNLSLGLDPPTLAASLRDDVRSRIPGVHMAVAVRTPDGRFAPLVGALAHEDHAVASSATLSGQVVARDDPAGGRVRAVPVQMGERVVAVAVLSGRALDADERARADAAIRDAGPRLAAALLFDQVRQLATTDERLRLARELHDGIAQELASMGYVLDDLVQEVPAAVVEDVVALREHVRRVTSDLRVAMFDLRAVVVDTLGATLAEHAQRIAAAGRFVAHTTIDEQGDRLPEGTEYELLRIAAEAMTNVRKHAKASHLWVECLVDAPDVLLRIADDGVGVSSPRPGAMGLRGMHERAQRIGGTVTVGGRPGGGTVIEVRVGHPRTLVAPAAVPDIVDVDRYERAHASSIA